jgi:hypothetical protein
MPVARRFVNLRGRTLQSIFQTRLNCTKLPCSFAFTGTTPHALTVRDVPVDGFWSVIVYNKDGFFEGPANGDRK